MRRCYLPAFGLIAALACATPGLALEKTAARMMDDRPDTDWLMGSTCSIAYFNTCTGWIWTWSDWAPGDILGVLYDDCCFPSQGIVFGSWVFVSTAAQSGYGYTGTISLAEVTPDDCPCGALQSQPFLPISGWNAYYWDAVPPRRFALTVDMGPTPGNPISFASDHPAAGASGPIACGTCYPSTREGHSRHWGNPAELLCPGVPLNDGVCNAEFLWQIGIVCFLPVSVEEVSWGRIKGLYR